MASLHARLFSWTGRLMMSNTVLFIMLQPVRIFRPFSVPNSLVVTLERVLGNETVAELLTTNKLSELACLPLYLMYEKKQRKKSFWYPYIRELDHQRGWGQLAVESPLLWSESELNCLTGSHTKAEVLERLRGSRENTMSLTLSGLWPVLYFRIVGTKWLRNSSAYWCLKMDPYAKMMVGKLG